VHAFVKKDEQLKQLPLALVVMSGRRKKNYKCVFRAPIAALPKRAVQKVLPGVIQRGCASHLGQAVWQNVQSAGLQHLYTTDDCINRVCHQTIALPQMASDDPHMVLHIEYMEHNWINSNNWLPSAWSVFRQPVRTNNDIKGWHCHLNDKASHGQLNL